MTESKLQWVKFFIKSYFPHDYMGRIDVDNLTDTVELCYTSNIHSSLYTMPNKKRVYIKYYETEKSHYFIMDVKCLEYDYFDNLIRTKQINEWIEREVHPSDGDIAPTGGGNLASHYEYHIKVDKHNSFIRLQSWEHQIVLNSRYKKNRNVSYKKEWKGRLRYDVDKGHTLMKSEFRRRRRKAYFHQYLSMKNYLEIPGFENYVPMLRKCLETNDHNDLFKNLNDEDAGELRFSNHVMRTAKTIKEALIMNNQYKNVPKRILDKGLHFSNHVMKMVHEKDISKITVYMKDRETQLNIVMMTLLDSMPIVQLVDYDLISKNDVINAEKVKDESLAHEDSNVELKRKIQRMMVNRKLYHLNTTGRFDGYNKNHNEFFVTYYKHVFVDHGSKEIDRGIIKDYVNMVDDMGEKLNLDIKSFQRLRELHNDIGHRYTLKKISGKLTVDEDYKLIKFDHPDYKVKMISDIDTLVQEGLTMKHCVVSYFEKINNGQCAIFHIDKKGDGGDGWTIEVNKTGLSSVSETGEKIKPKFRISQVRGRWNKSAPEEVKNDIKRMVGEIIEDDQPRLEPVDNRARHNEYFMEFEEYELPF